MSRIYLAMTLCMFVFNVAAAQSGRSTPLSANAQQCSALTEVNLDAMPAGAAFILSATSATFPPVGWSGRYTFSAGLPGVQAKQ
jgi:hypothetical protein